MKVLTVSDIKKENHISGKVKRYPRENSDPYKMYLFFIENKGKVINNARAYQQLGISRTKYFYLCGYLVDFYGLDIRSIDRHNKCLAIS